MFICRKLQWYGKPLKQLGLLSRQADIRRATGASSVNYARVERRIPGGCRATVAEPIWGNASGTALYRGSGRLFSPRPGRLEWTCVNEPRALSSKLEQLAYEAKKAFEQYDAVDARNRLAASELERRWNEKLEEIEAVKHRNRWIGCAPIAKPSARSVRPPPQAPSSGTSQPSRRERTRKPQNSLGAVNRRPRDPSRAANQSVEILNKGGPMGAWGATVREEGIAAQIGRKLDRR